MATRNAPGVYITNSYQGPPVSSAPTPGKTPIIFGLTERGPAWTPIKLSGDIDTAYKAAFGAPLTNEVAFETAKAAGECYFVRMLNYDSPTASTDLTAVTASTTLDSMGSATRASVIGTVAFPVNFQASGKTFVLDVNEDGDETNTFSATSAARAGTTTATVGSTTVPSSCSFSYTTNVNGPTYTLDLSGATLSAASAAGLVAYLNTVMIGVTVSESTGTLTFTTDKKGTAQRMTLSAMTSAAQTLLGFSAATATGTSGTGFCADLHNVTFAEFAAAGVSEAITITQTADLKPKLTVNSGVYGASSSIVIGAGTLNTILGFSAGTTLGTADSTVEAIDVFSGYRGVKSPGTFGNRVSVEVESAAKYVTKATGNDLSSSILAGALTMSMASVTGLSVGSMISVATDGEITEYKKVVSIAQALGTTGSASYTVTVNSPFEYDHDTTTEINSIEYNFKVYVDDVLAETFKGLSPSNTSPNYYVSRINSTVSGSRFIFIEAISETVPLDYATATLLSGGTAGSAVTSTDFKGSAEYQTGIYCLTDVQENGKLIAAPIGANSALAEDEHLYASVGALYCADIDAMFLANAPAGMTAVSAVEWRNETLGLDTDCVLIPSLNQVYILDTESSVPGTRKMIPSTGFYMAKAVNALRISGGGVGADPAGPTEFGNIRVVGLEKNYSKAEKELLYVAGLNYISTTFTSGAVSYFFDGAKTLASERQNMFYGVVNLRKYISRAVAQVLAKYVHRANIKSNWDAAAIEVNNSVMKPLLDSKQLNPYGGSAYYVICDATTTTSTDVDNGITNMRVGFVPSLSTEVYEVAVTRYATSGIPLIR